MEILLTIIILLAALTSFLLLSGLLRLLLRNRLETGRRLSGLLQPEGVIEGRAKAKRNRALPGLPQRRLVKLENELYMAHLMLRADEFILGWVLLTLLLPGLMLFLGMETVAVLGMIIPEEQGASGLEEQLLDLIIRIRQQARAAKNWAMADAIRDGLKELGLIIEDTKEGARWKRI